MGEEGLKITELAREFESENPGVKVITQAIPWDAAHEKLLTAVVGKLPPDVSQMGTTWMAEFATLKALEPLESYMDQSKTIREQNFFEGSWKTAVVNGKVYGIPWYVDTRVLFYRKDLLLQAGFKKPPENWDELKDVCRAIVRINTHNGKVNGYGLPLPVRGWGEFLPFVWQNEGDVFHPSDPKFEEALKFYVSFFRENLTPLGRSADIDVLQAFKSGFYSMFVSGPWMVELIQRELPELDGKWGVAVLPGKIKRTSFVGGCNLVVFKDSKHKELAWKFVEFLSSPEVQLKWFHVMKDLPSTKEAWKYPDLNTNPMLKVFGEQMKDTNSPPVIPEWEQIANIIDTRMEAIILKEKVLDKNIPSDLRALDKEIDEIVHRKKAPPIKIKVFLFETLAVVGIIALLGSLISKINLEKLKGTPLVIPKANLIDFKTTFIRSIPGYLFVAPAIIILTLFLFVPVIFSFLVSLTDWNIYGLADSNMVGFVGLKNYVNVFQDPIFWKSLWNTLLFTGVGVPLTIMVSLLFATVLNEKFIKFKTFFRTAYFIPVVSTIVAVAVIWRWLYNPEYGLLNYMLKCLSLPQFNWLADPKTALASLILMAAWKNFGYNMVIFLAGLQSIPETLYESARIDGANAWQLFLHVTLPGLRTTTIFVIIMSTIGYLQFFAEPYIMTKGGPLNSTMSIVLYMYNQGFKFFELGYASALAYVLFGIVFMFTFIQIRIRKSGFTLN